MTRLNSEIILNLSGNLISRARAYSAAMQRFSESNSAMARGFRGTVSSINSGMDAIENRYTGLIAAVAGGAIANRIVTLDRRLSRLSVAADISKEKTRQLYEQMETVSRSEGIRINPKETLEGIEIIMEKIGDLKFASENMTNIALFSQATGARGGDIGAVLTQLKKLAIETNQDVMTAMDSLNVQGKSGAFTMKSFAENGERLLATYASTGRKGVKAVLEVGAAMQVIRSGAGSDDQAVTSYEALVRELTVPDRVKKLKELAGIHIFDSEKLAKGIEVMRPLPALMDEIITKAGSSKTLTMSQALDTVKFGEEAMRALKPLMGEFSQSGEVTAFEKFLAVTADGSTTLKDAAKVAQDFQASIDNLMTALHSFANRELTGPFQDLSNAINSVDTQTLNRWLDTGKAIGIALTAAIAARKALGVASDLKNVFGNRGSGPTGNNPNGNGPGLDVIPVYVVNMPGSLGSMPNTESPNSNTESPNTERPSRRSRWLNIAANMGTLGYGMMALAPDFSPISINRRSDSLTDIPESMHKFVKPGFLDAWDDISNMIGNAFNPGQQTGEISGKIAIEMYDNRAKVQTADVRYNGIPLTINNGLSMAD